MNRIFTVLIAVVLIVVLIAVATPPANAGRPCVINCPSASPACVALALAQCSAGWIDGSVIWMWEMPDPDQRPFIEVGLTGQAILPDDHFRAFTNPPKKDLPWGGEKRIIGEPLR